MISSKYFDKAASLFAANRLLKFFIVIIGVSNIFLGIMAYRAVKYQKTVLIPLDLHSKIILNGDRINQQYLLQFSRDVFDLALNYTPATVKRQYSFLLSMVSPTTYHIYKSEFTTFAEEASIGNMCSAFVIDKLWVNQKKHIVKASGKNLIYLEGAEAINSKYITYAFVYEVREGRLFIKKIGRYSDIVKKKNNVKGK